jgi:hypothetical protein
MEASRRRLEWVERENFEGWACTECAWKYVPAGPFYGESIDELKMNFELRRDKEFRSHVCAEHPRAAEKSG